MIKRILLIAFALVCSSSCGEMAVNIFPSSEQEIQIVVLRYQFGQNGSGYVSGDRIDTLVHFFALSLADIDASHGNHPTNYRDLPGAMMTVFPPLPVPVLNLSQCTWESMKIRDPRDGKRGILFWAGPVRMNSRSSAEAEGGFYLGGLDAEGDIFYLSRHDEMWKVDSVKLRWVS